MSDDRTSGAASGLGAAHSHMGRRRIMTREGVGPALLVLTALIFFAGCATGPPLGSLTSGLGLLTRTEGGDGGLSPRVDTSPEEGQKREALACGGAAEPPGWPDLPSGDPGPVLAPFPPSPPPAEFVALQERVDMPRLVEALDDWRAARLGALGPVREDAALLLQRKRAAFLVDATERYGVFHAEVFALFVLHSAHDDEVREVLRLLAQDKQLVQTLGLMPVVREELAARGLSLSAWPEREERAR